MISLPSIFASSSQHRLLRRVSLIVSVCAFCSALSAQSEPAPAAAGDAAANADRRSRRQSSDGRSNFNPEEMQQRLANMLREQLGITDDAEWKLISERVAAVSELRRSSGGGFGGFRPQGSQSSGRTGRSGSPEQDALRQAVMDKLPEAEIKARLQRLRDVRKANEEKLTKAQEDLRAVLTVRQEAVAVIFGLLP